MVLTVKEMETLCVFHAGTLSATLATLREAAGDTEPQPRLGDIRSLIAKLSGMEDGDAPRIAFEPET